MALIKTIAFSTHCPIRVVPSVQDQQLFKVLSISYAGVWKASRNLKYANSTVLMQQQRKA